MSATKIRILALAIALTIAASPAAHAVTFDWVTIADPGNPPDDRGQGSVAYAYQIARFETTNAQYVEFLDAVAASDPHALYNPSMTSDVANGGIVRSGSPGSYDYAVKPGFENKPVNYVSFWDALRFANWLHNGQQSDPATTESGAYTLTPGAIAADTVVRNPGAQFFATGFAEFGKAAFYAGAGRYFLSAAGSDSEMHCVPPTAAPNSGNCGIGAGQVTPVGSYPSSPSPSGTFDQGGNIQEWCDDWLGPGAGRSLAGGSFEEDVYTALRDGGRSGIPTVEQVDFGFRIARRAPTVPALGPAGAMVLLASILAAARWQRGLSWSASFPRRGS
jgi:sulfatase-modifying factor enzyme 1